MLIEAIPDAIFLKDSQSRWLVTNEAAKQLFRLNEIEWQGKTEMELACMRPEFKEAHERCLQDDNSAWEAGKLTFFDEIMIDELGNKSYFEVRKNPSFNEAGHPENLLIIGRDVTEQRKSNDKLRVAAIAFESQEGMLVTDANEVILSVNQAFTFITGYSAEETVGTNLRILGSGQHDADFYFLMWKSINDIGSWSGEIWHKRKNGNVNPMLLTITSVKGEDGKVINYVGTLIDITERKRAEKEIEHLAFYDPLTHLPNRRLLIDRLKQALSSRARSGRDGAILFLDLDHFKTLNDSLGHDVGDLLLQQVAERLTHAVREGDTVARLGGDEYVIMLEDLSESELEAAAQVETISEKILNALNLPYQLSIQKYHCTPSIGIALFSGHEQSYEDLLKHADIAMYQAKKAGRNTLRFFDPKMQQAIHARVDLERELRKALDQQQFHLYYQVQVDISERPLGAEALIRWLHPERGLISPFHFIPLAEETGLILPIGLWVLETACAQLKKWEQDPISQDLSISINVSAKQFYQSDFVLQVQSAVRRHAIDPMKLKLELTESMLLDNIEDTIVKMNALKEIGIRFSLDDFGTGYSSLQYLKRLPLTQLKIDQSFVRDIETDYSDQEIVRTIIAMAQSLRLEVIAEGVETNEQLGLLLNNGCLHYQGYLFGKPVPIDEFEIGIRKE
jgi:diguanylate cyclase (GGDEF)-like protein/PAS domain S-box-containing protein